MTIETEVLILCGLFTRKVTSLTLRTLSEMSLDERADGSGTLTFGPTPPPTVLVVGVGMGQASRRVLRSTRFRTRDPRALWLLVTVAPAANASTSSSHNV